MRRPLFSALTAVLFAGVASAATPMQPGFSDTVIASNLAKPTALEWAPDGSGRLFVSLQGSGLVTLGPGAARRWYKRYSPLYSDSECGSLGFCFDPDFVRNRLVYSFVSVSASEQRIYRMVDYAGVGAGAVAILSGLPTRGVNHNGGALGFGSDAHLYWAVGDNGSKRGVDADLSLLAGKVGRAFADGAVPADNPFLAAPAPRNPFIWAVGFRNPFSLAVQPRTGALWLNVVGSSPDGQTAPHSTPGFEQIFALNAADDGGYDDYEGNQPAGTRFGTPARTLVRPLVQYKTDYGGEAEFSSTLASISRQSGLLTVITTTPHTFRAGQIVIVGGTDAFDGTYLVHEVTGQNGFTALDSAPDQAAVANQGLVRPPGGDGCVTGGAFYESTAFPAAMRGGFFFGDANTGTLWQLLVDAQGQPSEVKRFVTGGNAITDVALGPDGALYYASLGEGTIHRVTYQQPTDLIVTPTTFQMIEGGTARLSVRLPAAPSANVAVSVAVSAGSVSIAKGATLTFTRQNWQVPQFVTLTAAVDADTSAASGDLSVTATGYPAVGVHVNVIDTTAKAPLVTTQALAIPKASTRSFQVSLPSQPAQSVTLVARRTGGSAGAVVQSGATLVFTPANWNVPRTVTISMARNAPAAESLVEVWGRGYFRRAVRVAPQ